MDRMSVQHYLPKESLTTMPAIIFVHQIAKYRQDADVSTVKPVLSGHLKIDKTKFLMDCGTLMKVKSIAECSPWSIAECSLTD